MVAMRGLMTAACCWAKRAEVCVRRSSCAALMWPAREWSASVPLLVPRPTLRYLNERVCGLVLGGLV